MSSQLRTLFKLQSLDVGLLAKRSQIDAYEATLSERRKAMETCRARIDKLADQRKELVVQRALAERHVSDQEELLKQKRQRLQRVRSEREQRAAEDEISILQEEISEAETKALELITRVEEFEAELERARADFKGLEDADHRHVTEDALRIEALKGQLSEERSARDTVAAQLETPVRKRYDLILSRRGGIAVVEVREGCCAGCHMQIPPQVQIEILKTGAMHVCPSCQRILYLRAPDEEASVSNPD